MPSHIGLSSRLSWRPVYGVFLAVLFTYIYWSPFSFMLKLWMNEDYNYCFLIPPVLGHIIWSNRTQLRQVVTDGSWHGLWVLAAGGLLYYVGEFSSEFYTIFLSSLLMLLGLTVSLSGFAVARILNYPFLLYLCMLPLPKFLNVKLSLQLQLISSRLGEALIWLMGIPVYREGNILELEYIQLQVVEACSGLRYLFPLIALGLILAYYLRSRIWAKIMLVASAVPITVLLNAFRLAVTALAAKRWGEAAVEGFAHDLAGWVVFVLSFAILYMESITLGRMAPLAAPVAHPAHPAPSDGQAPTLPGVTEPLPGGDQPVRVNLLRYCLIVTLLSLVALFVTGRGGQETPPAAKPFNTFPMQLGEWNGVPRQISSEELKSLKLTDYVQADYTREGGGEVSLYIAYYKSQRKGEAIHSPETCLPGSGWQVEQDADLTLQTKSTTGDMLAHRSVITKDGSKLITYYWFAQRGRTYTSLPMLKFSTLIGAVTQHRTDGSFVRVHTALGSGETVEKADERIRKFMDAAQKSIDEVTPD